MKTLDQENNDVTAAIKPEHLDLIMRQKSQTTQTLFNDLKTRNPELATWLLVRSETLHPAHSADAEDKLHSIRLSLEMLSLLQSNADREYILEQWA